MPVKGAFQQNWDNPGVYKDLMAVFAERYKPSKKELKAVVEQMHARGYQFTVDGL